MNTAPNLFLLETSNLCSDTLPIIPFGLRVMAYNYEFLSRHDASISQLKFLPKKTKFNDSR